MLIPVAGRQCSQQLEEEILCFCDFTSYAGFGAYAVAIQRWIEAFFESNQIVFEACHGLSNGPKHYQTL